MKRLFDHVFFSKVMSDKIYPGDKKILNRFKPACYVNIDKIRKTMKLIAVGETGDPTDKLKFYLRIYKQVLAVGRVSGITSNRGRTK